MAIVIAVFGIGAYAQKVEEVTLTVSGDGATKQEATAVALRSAIEQAFGVFVSANTTILDDELVKDEIATVSSGNIKRYEEIASATLPNGNTTVTLKAIVSISKLVSYAQSKGNTAEFAGATFGMNMKLKELNKANEEKAIANMIAQLEALAPTMFDYKLDLGEPFARGETYIIPAGIDVFYSNNTETVNSIFLNTLTSLSLSKEEQKEYDASHLPIARYVIGTQTYSDAKGDWRLKNEMIFNLRSEASKEMLTKYVEFVLSNAIIDFQIVDNTNTVSFFTVKGRMGSYIIESRVNFSGLISSVRGDYFPQVWEPSVHLSVINFRKSGYTEIPHIIKKNLPKSGLCYKIKIEMTIPKEDISKYSNFTITHK